MWSVLGTGYTPNYGAPSSAPPPPSPPNNGYAPQAQAQAQAPQGHYSSPQQQQPQYPPGYYPQQHQSPGYNYPPQPAPGYYSPQPTPGYFPPQPSPYPGSQAKPNRKNKKEKLSRQNIHHISNQSGNNTGDHSGGINIGTFTGADEDDD
ncbi:hypothetical protein FNV43_RR00306 [Rhamnella rubrinervis]|uniref:Uncharacterized protein n=1 Tax=Rhamnella rubrinervis TaxID=2594499 RepID=A0A8K0HNB5_9ROSA|nr:hypothetical protein FNV43_RR00306 [Rhamnella rubrinervis]